MNNENNNRISSLKLSLYIISALLIFSLIITIISLNLRTDTSNTLDNKFNHNQNEINNSSTYNKTIIKLKKDHEIYIVDQNLQLEFMINNDSDSQQQYKLNIILNKNVIDSTFFDGSNIWSEDYTGIFNVYDVDNYYVLVSSVAKQCDGDYVLIINKEGKVLKTYADVKFNIKKTIISIEDNDTCSVDNFSLKKEEYDVKTLK